MLGKQTFTVTDDHIRLLKRAYVTWLDCEFGAPSIECKRPYGNSDVYGDINVALGYRWRLDDESDEDFDQEDLRTMDRLHKETETALQIFLRTGTMAAGTYETDKYFSDWRLTPSKPGDETQTP